MPLQIRNTLVLLSLVAAAFAQDPVSAAAAANTQPNTQPSSQPAKRIAFRTSSGYFITAENGGGASVHTDRQALGPWETFTLESAAPGIFTFRSDAGTYLSDLSGETPRAGREARTMLSAAKKQVDDSTKFKLVVVNPDTWTVAIVTSSGKYITAENNGGMKARGSKAVSTNRTEIGDWEQFQLVDVDKQPPPAQ